MENKNLELLVKAVSNLNISGTILMLHFINVNFDSEYLSELKHYFGADKFTSFLINDSYIVCFVFDNKSKDSINEEIFQKTQNLYNILKESNPKTRILSPKLIEFSNNDKQLYENLKDALNSLNNLKNIFYET